ncbi:hypothetical protein BJX61DRAFT_536707 [Aspergillus egyptiacus]|nr:hypothetical protein BJX61DRAFT_536707 [Aspergillus egyptiacus]
MSENETHPGRGLGSAVRRLFASASASAPPPRHRVSLLRRSRTVFSQKIRTETSDRRPVTQRTSNPDPPAMLGPSELKCDNFDVFEWYTHYQTCQRYFIDHARHSDSVQAVASYLNIRLPFQRHPPISDSSTSSFPNGGHETTLGSSSRSTAAPSVSLIPYIRRLVATGMDSDGVMHGFFGDDWRSGVGTLHEQERRNYMFAAKSGGWASVKKDYDIPPLETIPFLRPLQGPLDSEIEAAERSWSEWLAMEDWMIGSRSPDVLRESPSQSSQARSAGG